MRHRPRMDQTPRVLKDVNRISVAALTAVNVKQFTSEMSTLKVNIFSNDD